MKFADDDALDRALAALPLEQPPPGLRAAILAATVYRTSPPFSVPEGVAAASILAALAWIALAFRPQVFAGVAVALSNFAVLQWLVWIALGAAITIFFAILTESQPAYAAAKGANRPTKP